MRTLALALLLAASTAHAEGELGPMVGGGIVASHGDTHDVAGFGAELVLWYGPLGLGTEVSRQWSVDDVTGPRVTTLAASLRLLAFHHVIPSLLDSRDVVDLGIELQGIAMRSWWDEADSPLDYGFGVAVRLRGTNDDDRSNLLAESRVFVRVMREHEDEMAVAARDLSPGAKASGVGIIVGLGALWGGGKAGYVSKLRRNNSLDSEWMVGR